MRYFYLIVFILIALVLCPKAALSENIIDAVIFKSPVSIGYDISCARKGLLEDPGSADRFIAGLLRQTRPIASESRNIEEKVRRENTLSRCL